MSSCQIRELTEECLSLLKQLVVDLRSSVDDQLQQQLKSFNIWIAYTGALAKGKASLDERLKDTDNITLAVLELLRLVQSCLSTDRRNNSYQEVSEALNAAIDSLHKLAVAIRRSSVPNSRFKLSRSSKTDRSTEPYFEDLAKTLVRTKFNNAKQSLCDHVGASISQRRKRILYQMRHNRNLEPRQSITDINLARNAFLGNTEHGQLPAGQPERKNLPNVTFRLPDPSNTSASAPNKSIFERIRFQAARTVMSGRLGASVSSHDVEYPKIPTASSVDNVVQCPYCGEPIASENLQGSAGEKYWRQHIDRDLQPYVCISERCGHPFEYFVHSNDWIKHMTNKHTENWKQTVHGSVWICDIKHSAPQTFERSDDFEAHLKKDHHPSPTDAQCSALLRKKKVLSTRKASFCPFCEASVDLPNHPLQAGNLSALDDHIADHLKYLAFFSLPNMDLEPPNTDNNGSEQAVSFGKSNDEAEDDRMQELANIDLNFDEPDSSKSRSSSEIERETERIGDLAKDVERSPSTLFACPYYKYDELRYSSQNSHELSYRGCSTCYLTDISRVKQHLRRVHSQPDHYCPRCFEIFEPRQLEHHLNDAVLCSKKECPFPEKLTTTQKQQIFVKRPNTPATALWNQIYQVLFPDSPLPPNPFCAISGVSFLNEAFEIELSANKANLRMEPSKLTDDMSDNDNCDSDGPSNDDDESKLRMTQHPVEGDVTYLQRIAKDELPLEVLSLYLEKLFQNKFDLPTNNYDYFIRLPRPLTEREILEVDGLRSTPYPSKPSNTQVESQDVSVYSHQRASPADEKNDQTESAQSLPSRASSTFNVPMDAYRGWIDIQYTDHDLEFTDDDLLASYFGDGIGGSVPGMKLILGDVGAGKSILMRLIVEAYRQKQPESVVLVHSFAADRTDLNASLKCLLRSLLCDLCLDKSHGNMFYERIGQVWQKTKSEQRTDDLEQTFIECISELHVPLLIAIDAIDVCELTALTAILSFTASLQWLPVGIDICIAGRPLDIAGKSLHLPEAEMMTLEKLLPHKRSIIQYVTKELSSFQDPVSNANDVRDLGTLIAAFSHGNFLWAELALRLLHFQNYRLGDIDGCKAMIRSLPRRIPDLYDVILQQIKLTTYGDFTWLIAPLFAFRPLTVAEVAAAVYYVNSEQLQNQDFGTSKVELKHNCPLIKEVPNGYVSLIHRTLSLHLEKSGLTPGVDLVMEELIQQNGHLTMATLCEQYLDSALTFSDLSKQQQRITFPFFDYTTKYLLPHAEQAAKTCNIDRLVNSLLEDSNVLKHILSDPTHFDKFLDSQDRKHFLHVLVSEELTNLMSVVVEKKVDLNVRDDNGNTALMKACDQGAFEIVVLLVHAGASLNLRSDKGMTEIAFAARNGHLRVMIFLVDQGSEINSRRADGHTPLSLAIAEDHKEIVEYLVGFQTIDLSNYNSNIQSSLAWTATAGHLDILNILAARKDFQVNESDARGRTALSLASGGGYLDLAQRLLKLGADIDQVDHTGRTPLSWAAENGHYDIAKLLFENGAWIYSMDDQQRTPLSYTSEKGHTRVAALLYVARRDFQPTLEDSIAKLQGLSVDVPAWFTTLVDTLIPIPVPENISAFGLRWGDLAEEITDVATLSIQNLAVLLEGAEMRLSQFLIPLIRRWIGAIDECQFQLKMCRSSILEDLQPFSDLRTQFSIIERRILEISSYPKIYEPHLSSFQLNSHFKLCPNAIAAISDINSNHVKLEERDLRSATLSNIETLDVVKCTACEYRLSGRYKRAWASTYPKLRVRMNWLIKSHLFTPTRVTPDEIVGDQKIVPEEIHQPDLPHQYGCLFCMATKSDFRPTDIYFSTIRDYMAHIAANHVPNLPCAFTLDALKVDQKGKPAPKLHTWDLSIVYPQETA